MQSGMLLIYAGILTVPQDQPELRAIWTEKGVSQSHQEDLILQIAAKGAPRTRVGVFIVGDGGGLWHLSWF